MRKLFTQCFRAYAVIGVLAAGFTALWTLGVIDVAVPFVGYAWLGVAAVGTVVAVGMITKKETVIEPDAAEERIDDFEDATVTGRPFDLYIGALAMWAAVSFGWVLGGMGAAGLTVVGYGWFAIAAYGLVVGLGIALNHKEDVADAIDPTETAAPTSDN
jgi:hypothetical protein